MPDLLMCPDPLRRVIETRPDRIPEAFSGTHIKRIVAGEWPQLYLELTGQVQPEPLLDLAPNLGKFLEPFHRWWYEWQSGQPIRDVGWQPVKIIPQYDPPAEIAPKWAWAYATLDGVVDVTEKDWMPWEAKTTGGFMARDKLIEREFPQLQWQMYVTERDMLMMSVMYLNTRWECFTVERDNGAIEKILDQVDQFRDYLVQGIMPQEQVAPPITPVRERVDMRVSFEWQEFEEAWLEHRPHVKKFKDAEKKLKGQIPPDAKDGFGALLKFSRNKAGAITLFPMKSDEREQLPPMED